VRRCRRRPCREESRPLARLAADRCRSERRPGRRANPCFHAPLLIRPRLCSACGWNSLLVPASLTLDMLFAAMGQAAPGSPTPEHAAGACALARIRKQIENSVMAALPARICVKECAQSASPVCRAHIHYSQCQSRAHRSIHCRCSPNVSVPSSPGCFAGVQNTRSGSAVDAHGLVRRNLHQPARLARHAALYNQSTLLHVDHQHLRRASTSKMLAHQHARIQAYPCSGQLTHSTPRA